MTKTRHASRATSLDYVLGTAQLSGSAPSPFLSDLLCQYREGIISSRQLIERLRAHYPLGDDGNQKPSVSRGRS